VTSLSVNVYAKKFCDLANQAAQITVVDFSEKINGYQWYEKLQWLRKKASSILQFSLQS